MLPKPATAIPMSQRNSNVIDVAFDPREARGNLGEHLRKVHYQPGFVLIEVRAHR
jgi:hypothetical protein